MKAKEKIITDLKKSNHVIVLDSAEDANNYDLDVSKLNEIIEEIINESVCLGRSNDIGCDIPGLDTRGMGDEAIYSFGDVYFIFSGGGMSAEIIEAISKAEAGELLNKWKN